ncbi:chorismate-binding protein [Lutibacter sp.]
MQKETTEFIHEILRFYKEKSPLVIFRKPNETNLKAYIQKDKEVHFLDSFNAQGFIFAPFNKNEKKVLFPINKCSVLTSKSTTDTDLEIIRSNTSSKVSSNKKSKEKHIQLVQKGIDFLKNNNVKKVVLSRKETIESTNFTIENTFKKMLNNYKNAFVYLWYHPSIGLWMGATPERLINVTQNKFTTMALAGTQLYKSSVHVVWKQKEQREQQFVTDYILNTIKGSVQNIKVSEAYTVKAGNLLHIRTDITGVLKSASLLENLVETLHPTPAVCGLPKKEATKFIFENENYNRAYYAGYLGELNIEKNTHLFVNLRCMQVNNKIASIYVGGGITTDSNPENEWEETVSKAEVMKKVL